MTDNSNDRLCVNCEWFNGINGRDICLFHGTSDKVRGAKPIPTWAHRERAQWVLFGSKDRCGPEGKNWMGFVDRGPLPPADDD